MSVIDAAIEAAARAMAYDHSRSEEHWEEWKPVAARSVAVGIALATAACVGIAANPGFIECRDTEWDEGVNFAKRFIRDAIARRLGEIECELNAATEGDYLPRLFAAVVTRNNALCGND